VENTLELHKTHPLGTLLDKNKNNPYKHQPSTHFRRRHRLQEFLMELHRFEDLHHLLEKTDLKDSLFYFSFFVINK
jgi:hypothetical protein